jgi:hypothetical protein
MKNKCCFATSKFDLVDAARSNISIDWRNFYLTFWEDASGDAN